MNEKFLTLAIPSPFVLRLSKDERRVFQQNHLKELNPTYTGCHAIQMPRKIRLDLPFPKRDLSIRG